MLSYQRNGDVFRDQFLVGAKGFAIKNITNMSTGKYCKYYCLAVLIFDVEV